jgi:hypothetical protein
MRRDVKAMEDAFFERSLAQPSASSKLRLRLTGIGGPLVVNCFASG